MASCSSEGEQLCSAMQNRAGRIQALRRERGTRAADDLTDLRPPLHRPVIREPSCPFLPASPSSSSAQTVYFGAVRLSVFVVNAFRGGDMVLLFHPDIPLGPSCGQCHKKQIMLLVSVLSNLHKTMNTSHRDFLQL